MDKFRFGILGPAKIAHRFAHAVGMMPDAELVAVASSNLGRAKEFAERNHIPAYYGSYEEMLSRDDIDGVYIATTNNFHYDNLLQCIEHGKHVLCEKSMVMNQRDAETVFAKAKEKGVFVMEAMWRRFLPHMQRAREWVRSGAIGRVEMAQCTIGFRGTLEPENRIYNTALGGGGLYDIGVYAIEVTGFLVGEAIRDVKTMLSFVDTGADNVMNISVRYERCIANLQCITTSQIPQQLYLYGTEGYIWLDSPVGGDTARLYGRDGELIEECRVTPENGFLYEAQETVRCARAGKLESEVVPHRDTIECAAIFDQCMRENERYIAEAAPLNP